MARADRESITEYLRGRLTEAEEEQVELRLLTDPEFAEEYDIVVNEVVDDYVAGKFEGEDLRQVEDHFFKHPERRNKLKFALALKEHGSRERPMATAEPAVSQFRLAVLSRPKWKFTQQLAIAASILIAIGAGFGVWRLYFYQSDLNKGLVALRAAFKDERPTEARLSDFTYAPVANQRGGPAKVDYLQRDLAASLLLKEVSEHPSAASHHALGQYYLTERQFDKAIDQFRTALALNPNNAENLSDYGAALLEEGKMAPASQEGKGVNEFAESLRHLNKALEMDSSGLEALFNRALLYEYLGLPHKAAEDWQRYLQLDPESKWASEAQQNLRRVEEKKRKTSQSQGQIFQEFLNSYNVRDEQNCWKIVSSYHNRTGNVVFEQLLDNYLEDETNGRDNEAHRNLQMLSYVGDLTKQRTGDCYFYDLARLYASASPERRTNLARAREVMKAAHDGWGRIRVATSLSQFSEAKRLFEQFGDIGNATFAEYWVSFCHYQQHQTNEGLAAVQRSIAAASAKSYKWIHIRALYLTSILQYDLSNYSEALEAANRSLEMAQQTADAVGELNSLTSLIEYYRFLSNFGKSLSHVQDSLSLLNLTTLDPIQGCRHYGFVALSLAAAGWYEAAAAYQEEALRYALNTGRPVTISYNFAFLGQINGKLKKFDAALSNVRRAFEIAQAQSDEPAGRDCMAYASLQMGNIYRQAGDPANALESYNRSIELYEKLDFSTQLYQAYKGRLFCHIELGNDQLAEREISIAVTLAESYRDKILEEENRNSFFNAEQNLYDGAIAYYSGRNASDTAFYYSELSHARSLLDLMNSEKRVLAAAIEPNLVLKNATHPLSLSEIGRRLPEQIQIVQFAVVENEILIWIIGNNYKTQSARVPVTRTDLEKKVEAYLQVLSTDTAEAPSERLRQAKDLYDILIQPAEPFLDKRKQVLIVPDKILSLLPFSTLIARTSGKYLLEDFILQFSPSSTMFIVVSEMASMRKAVDTERILSVGNPRFERDAFPSLPDLPAAAREASDVAGFYSFNSRRVLVGDQATAKRVEDEMRDSDVIHFAMHFVLDERFPLRSKFLLANVSTKEYSAEKQETVLFAYQIYGMNLARTRLAVLSACQTGAGPYLGGEGVMNMARPFMAAGVPLVLASLWAVDSDSTALLMVNFHKFRTQGRLRSAEALRQAQLEMLRGPAGQFRQPYHWAPFVIIGGRGDF